MNTLSRQDAIKQNLTYYFTGKSCPNGHTCLRKVHNSTCYICAQTARTLRQASVRILAVEKLGGKCVNCGFSDARALQIDHVNGGGVREQRAKGPNAVYLEVMSDYRGKYQLLCANCNWIKRFEQNENRTSGYDRTKIREVLDLLR